MSGQIFISYRREDSSASAGRLFDILRNHFAANQIFMDRHRGRHSMGTSTTMAPHPSVLLVQPIHANPLVSKANQSIHE
jgi:hypothetical protein